VLPHDSASPASFVIKKDEKIAVHLTNYGATIWKLFTPDREGRLGDIVLGLDSPSDYAETGNPGFFGATIGRCCNRIGGGKFQVDGNQVSG
jgi:aldose 1-epimerase